jgi:two-component system, OmpR family, response regulator
VAYDGESGLAAALSSRHDVAVVDLNLPGIDGVEAVTKTRRHWGAVPPVVVA